MGQEPLTGILEVDSGDFAGTPEPVMDSVAVDLQLLRTKVDVAKRLEVGQQRGREFGVALAQHGDALMTEPVAGSDEVQQLIDQDGRFHLAEGSHAHGRRLLEYLQDVADVFNRGVELVQLLHDGSDGGLDLQIQVRPGVPHNHIGQAGDRGRGLHRIQVGKNDCGFQAKRANHSARTVGRGMDRNQVGQFSPLQLQAGRSLLQASGRYQHQGGRPGGIKPCRLCLRMDLSGPAQQAGDPVLAHRLGLFIAVAHQLDGSMPCRSHQDPVRVRGKPFCPLLQPDVPKDSPARMDADGRVIEDPWRGIRSNEAHEGRDHLGDEFLTLIEDNIVPSTLIARREAWRSALPFPDWFAYASISDWYLNLRMARRHPLYYRARTIADYRIHDVNMHAQRVDGRAFEQTVFNVLDEMFEGDDRQREKSRMKPGVYARACFRAADRYAAQHMHRDAWRCRLGALRHSPNTVFDAVRTRARQAASRRVRRQPAATS